jgi:hypothetical protein
MLDDRDMLSDEIECWESFKYSTREESRLVFTKMLEESQKQEVEQFAKAMNSERETFASESLFMTLIL